MYRMIGDVHEDRMTFFLTTVVYVCESFGEVVRRRCFRSRENCWYRRLYEG